MSGGVDIRPFPKNWEIDRRLGNHEEYPEVWEAHTVINCLPLFKQQDWISSSIVAPPIFFMR